MTDEQTYALVEYSILISDSPITFRAINICSCPITQYMDFRMTDVQTYARVQYSYGFQNNKHKLVSNIPMDFRTINISSCPIFL